MDRGSFEAVSTFLVTASPNGGNNGSGVVFFLGVLVVDCGFGVNGVGFEVVPATSAIVSLNDGKGIIGPVNTAKSTSFKHDTVEINLKKIYSILGILEVVSLRFDVSMVEILGKEMFGFRDILSGRF